MNELMNGDLLDFFREQNRPFRQMMAFYKCASMEVETKFNVLNEEFSLKYDRNPIETIRYLILKIIIT